MTINNITLKGFRNYINKTVSFSDNINIFIGENAQGKTNLLEAVYFLSCGKSFRTQKDTDLIAFGQQKAYIKAEYESSSVKGQTEALLLRDGRKSINVNHTPIKKMTELFGNILTVIFSPEELKIVKESPSLRRKFLDMEISKIKPSYLYDLQNYEKALASKNALLRSDMKEGQIKKLASVFNIQIAEYGEQIVKRRKAFIEKLDEKAGVIHKKLTDNKENLGIKYRPCIEQENIKESLYKKLESSIMSEIENGYTLYGPHREDIVFVVNGKDAKIFASQGQQRTAMLSVKLCVANIIKEILNDTPVMLLDDVLSELDKPHHIALFESIKDMQAIVTTALETPKYIKGMHISEHRVINGDAKPV